VRIGAVLIAVCLCLTLPGAALAKKDQRDELAPPSSYVWVNPGLGLEYSQWLVGAIAWMASTEEIVVYLTLEDDNDAARFEEEFWQRRDADASVLFGGVRQTFNERSEAADRRFGEGTRRGRKTDRGAIYVLYGEPTSVDFETSAERTEPTLEVWSYDRVVEPGLDGRKPKQQFLFAKQGNKRHLIAGSLRRSRIRSRR